MKTVAFFSALENPDRSPCLLQCARSLARSGKRVVILECNVFAPALFQLFNKNSWGVSKTDRGGLLDYLCFFNDVEEADCEVGNYVSAAADSDRLFLMLARGCSANEYITSVLAIDWRRLFPEKGASSGVGLLLYIKDQLERIYKPDFLLIDAGAGLTDLSLASIRRTSMADEIICFCSTSEIDFTEDVLFSLQGVAKEEFPQV